MVLRSVRNTIYILSMLLANAESQATPAGKALLEDLGSISYPVGVDGVDSARSALQAGAKVLFLSGSWVSASVLGKPDTGFYRQEHAVEISRQILKKFPDAILLVDVDSGFGEISSAEDNTGKNIEAAIDTTKKLMELGVAGIVLDDQEPTDRRADVQPGKSVIPFDQFRSMIERVQAEAGDGFVVIGRTAAEDKNEALRRGRMLATRSDVVIVEKLNSDKEALLKLRKQTPGIRISTIQIDKGQDEIWKAQDHGSTKLDMVLMPTSLRRFEDKDNKKFDLLSVRDRLLQLTGKSEFTRSCHSITRGLASEL